MSWTTTNADSVSIDGGASLPADGSSTVSPVTTTTYVLTATGPGGSVTASVTITVNPVPAVDSFTAAPATITAGQSATLSWTTTNADSVSIDGGASLPADGSSTVSPVTTTTYVLTATGPGGSVTASVTITVNPVPAVDSFTAAPATITAGQSATLSWTTTNADSVSIDGGASLPADGSSMVSPVTTTAYVLTATGPGGSVTASVTITVNPVPAVVAAATPSSGEAPLTVVFSSASSSDPDGIIATFAWNFGDGTPVSSEANPNHIYADAGTFTAVLTVADNTGVSATASVAIAVTMPAPPNFTLKTFELNGSVLLVEIRDAVADAPVSIDGVGRGAIDGRGRYKNVISGFSSTTCEATVQVGDSSTQLTPRGCVPFALAP